MAQLSNIQVLTNGVNIQQKVLTNGRAFQFSGISLVNYKRNALTRGVHRLGRVGFVPNPDSSQMIRVEENMTRNRPK